MRKIFLVLLILAVAGAGAFAQVTVSGEVTAGLGLFMPEGDGNDQYVTGISHDPSGMRARANVTARNEAGTAGAFVQLQDLGLVGDANSDSVIVNQAYGWTKYRDGLITVQGGRIDQSEGFSSFDRMVGARMGERNGMRLILRPIDGLGIDLGGYIARTNNDVMIRDNTVKGVFAVSYTMQDTFRVVAGARNANRAGGGFDGNNPNIANGGIFAPANGTQASAAYFSFEYLGLPSGMHLSASVFGQNLEAFGDLGEIKAYLSWGYTGLVEGMDLRLNGAFGTLLGTPEGVRSPDPWVWVWASVDYRVSSAIVPRLDLHYVMGGNARLDDSTHFRDNARMGSTYNDKDSFFRAQPSVQFRVTGNMYTEIGGIFHFDLGDNPTWINRQNTAPHSTGLKSGTSTAAYALVRVAF